MHRPLLVLVVLAAACSREAPAGPPTSLALAPNATVISVSDGDTIVVRVDGQEEHVRLIGIDTPETKDPDEPVACFGAEATAFTKALLPKGTPVRLERDVEPRDYYGRLLAYVTRASDALFVNLELARRGYADALAIPPNLAHADEIRASVEHARADDLGLWGACSGFGVPAG